MPIDIEEASKFIFARLVPELIITNLTSSLIFWRDMCGFRVAYDRPEEGFAFMDLDGAQVMLEERDLDRSWIVGRMDVPFGRGINFQIEVQTIDPILTSLRSSNWPLYLAPEEKWYRGGDIERGVRQFLVQDPDGYLIRFSQGIGHRQRNR